MLPLTKNNWIAIGIVIGVIILITLTWMFGGMIRDSIKAYQLAKANEAVTEAQVNEAKAKVIAEEAIKKLDEANDRLGKQIEITKAAEDKLLKSNKISEEIKNDYEQAKQDILNKEYHSTNANLNTDELCNRAKQLGISCEE